MDGGSQTNKELKAPIITLPPYAAQNGNEDRASKRGKGKVKQGPGDIADTHTKKREYSRNGIPTKGKGDPLRDIVTDTQNHI